MDYLSGNMCQCSRHVTDIVCSVGLRKNLWVGPDRDMEGITA